MKIVISGGGVGGLTLAVLAARQGHQVEVHEKSARLRTLGAGFTLWSNATAILRRLGLGPWLERHGQPISHGLILNRSRCLVRHPIARLAQRWGSPTLAVHRGDLLEALAALVPAGCLKLDSAIQVRNEGADLFVAADGIHSAFRSDPLRYSGYLGSWGVAANPQPAILDSRWMLGPGATVGRIPLTGERVFWFATVAMPQSQARRRDFIEALQTFQTWPAEIRSFLVGLEPESVLVTPIYDRKPVRAWGDGHSWTLLGDAAHATTPSFGHGACLAIESAQELVDQLRETPLPQALRAYEQRRQARTAPIIQSSYWVGRLFHLGPRPGWLRDQALRFTPQRLHEVALQAIVTGGQTIPL